MARTTVSLFVMCMSGLLLSGARPEAARDGDGAYAAAQTAPEEQAPVTLDAQMLDAAGKSLSATIVNHGSHSVTAWTLRVKSTFADNTTDSMDLTRELYGSTTFMEHGAQLAAENRPLDAGASRPTRVPLGQRNGTVVSRAEGRVIAVVFDNGETWGDATALSAIFGKRDQDLTEVRALKALLVASKTPGARQARTLSDTRAAIKDFASKQAPDSGRVSRTLDLTIAQLERSVTEGKVSQEKANQVIEELLNLREAAAVRHTKSK